MELCLFQGTFNPIHNAHLRVAEYVVDKGYADAITFIPAFNPPHKDSNDNMRIHRYNMVQLAIEDNPKFQISDIEYRLGGKSYTYLTICKLYELFKPSDKIKFIIGTDAFRKIESWYETDKLKEKVHFLVFLRDKNFNSEEFQYLKEKGYNFELMPLEFEDISSTELRKAVKTKQNLSKYVPKKVEEYIKNNELYKN